MLLYIYFNVWNWTKLSDQVNKMLTEDDILFIFDFPLKGGGVLT
jgi:hypothetical protein